LSNPPWERIKLQEQEFFAARDPRIADAPNKAARSRLITELIRKNPALHAEFVAAVHAADCGSKFMRQGGQFPLTATGDINTYALFAELSRKLMHEKGRAGIIIPPGIASDDTNKVFFADLITRKHLVRLIAFVNEKAIFPSVLHNFRFAVLTFAGSFWNIAEADFAYECQDFKDVHDAKRHFTLNQDDLALLNPNTLTAPVFRSSTDAALTKLIYRRIPIILNECTASNPWGVNFLSMFHMSNDSELFVSRPAEHYVPLYEAKMMHQYDHRFGSFSDVPDVRSHMLPETSLEKHRDPNYSVGPCYWVKQADVRERLGNRWKHNWLVGFRGITSKSLERSGIFCVLPLVGFANSLPVMLIDERHLPLVACFLSNLNSLVFDYVVRQKIGGANFNLFIVKQLPVLPPEFYKPADVQFINPRVVELSYTAHDLKPFADALGYEGSPFQWDEARRALLRAELDAWFARAYGLTRDELRYILDPADVHGPDFPGETFRVLKEKETAKFGEYRTRRLVLDAWDRLASATRATAKAFGILDVPLPSLPSGGRQPLDTPAKYIAQFILSMLKLNNGAIDARELAEAFSLIASRGLCSDLAKIEFQSLGRDWVKTFNETTKPELFREILCELYDKEILDLADKENKPMVCLKMTDPVPENRWVELDVILATRLLAIVPRDVRYDEPVVMPPNKHQILARVA
jgi:hypothetical protein